MGDPDELVRGGTLRHAAVMELVESVSRGKLSSAEAAKSQTEMEQELDVVAVEFGHRPVVINIEDQNPWIDFFENVRRSPSLYERLRTAYREGVEAHINMHLRIWSTSLVEHEEVEAKLRDYREKLLAILDGEYPEF